MTNSGFENAVHQGCFGQLNLLLPSVPRDESLTLLDEYVEAVGRYRG